MDIVCFEAWMRPNDEIYLFEHVRCFQFLLTIALQLCPCGREESPNPQQLPILCVHLFLFQSASQFSQFSQFSQQNFAPFEAKWVSPQYWIEEKFTLCVNSEMNTYVNQIADKDWDNSANGKSSFSLELAQVLLSTHFHQYSYIWMMLS